MTSRGAIVRLGFHDSLRFCSFVLETGFPLSPVSIRPGSHRIHAQFSGALTRAKERHSRWYRAAAEQPCPVNAIRTLVRGKRGFLGSHTGPSPIPSRLSQSHPIRIGPCVPVVGSHSSFASRPMYYMLFFFFFECKLGLARS